MFKKILITAAVCLIAGFALGMYSGYKMCASGDAKQSAQYFAAGKEFYDKRMYPEAAEMFNRSLGLAPETESTRLLLSSSYRFMNLTALSNREKEQ